MVRKASRHCYFEYCRFSLGCSFALSLGPHLMNDKFIYADHRRLITIPNILFILYLAVAFPIYYAKYKIFSTMFICEFVGYSIIPAILFVTHSLKGQSKVLENSFEHYCYNLVINHYIRNSWGSWSAPALTNKPA